MIEVFVSKNWNGFSAYFLDSQGYKTIFSERNSYNNLLESIMEHFDVLKKDYQIKKSS